VARTQDGDQEVEGEGAVWTALRTRTQLLVFLDDRTTQGFVDRALGA